MFSRPIRLGLSLALVRLTAASFNVYAGQNHHAVAAALGVSFQCLLALNRTVECDQANAVRAARGVDIDIWHPSNLTDLCTDTCSESLASWLSAVETECSADRVTANGITFHPKAYPLKYIAGYDFACIRDTSEKFCILESQKWDGSIYTKWDLESCPEDVAPAFCSEQVLVTEAKSNSVIDLYTQEQYCSECFLLLWRQRLLSPTLPLGGFTDYLIDQFRLLENTCSTELPFTTFAPTLIHGVFVTISPTQAANSRRWVTSEASPEPEGRFTFGTSVTLHSGPYYKTAIPPKPTQPGAIEACGAYYTVAPGDTCSTIISQLGIGLQDLLIYNTLLDPDCHNLWSNYAICVAPVATPTSSQPTVPTDTGRNGPPSEHDNKGDSHSLDHSGPTTSSQPTESPKVSKPTGQPNSSEDISKDGKCNEDIYCVGSGFGDCCSTSGYCGSGPLWCGLGNCISGPCNSTPGQISTDGKCGPRFPGLKTCVGSAFGDCCSKRGYCGSSERYCAPENCHSGKCFGSTDDDDEEK